MTRPTELTASDGANQILLAGLVIALSGGCVAAGEPELWADLKRAEATLAELATTADEYQAAAQPSFDGSPEGSSNTRSLTMALLDLRLELARLHAGHAIAWANLERIVGHPTDGEAIVLTTNEPHRPR